MPIVIAAIISALIATSMASPSPAAQPLNGSENIISSLDPSKITTKWNLTFLYKDKDAARAEYERLNITLNDINQTFRLKFANLTGKVLLDYIQSDENYSKSLNVL